MPELYNSEPQTSDDAVMANMVLANMVKQPATETPTADLELPNAVVVDMAEMEQEIVEETPRTPKEREKMAREGMRVIDQVLNKYTNSGMDLDDLRSAGNKGLLKAINKYKPNEGMKFTTFAYMCINCAMLDEIRSQARKSKKIVSGHSPRYKDDESLTLLDSLPDESIPSEEEQALKLSRIIKLRETLNLLSAKQRQLIVLLFVEGMSYEEVGKILGVQPNTVATRRNRVIALLQEEMSAAA